MEASSTDVRAILGRTNHSLRSVSPGIDFAVPANSAVSVRRLLGRVADAVGVAVSIGLLVIVAVDLQSPVRAVLALGFVVVVPGWTACRLLGAQFSAATVLASCALSLAAIMITGELLVTRLEWQWQAVAGVWCGGCASGLAAVLIRGRGDG